jgi:hypothetical protein
VLFTVTSLLKLFTALSQLLLPSYQDEQLVSATVVDQVCSNMGKYITVSILLDFDARLR